MDDRMQDDDNAADGRRRRGGANDDNMNNNNGRRGNAMEVPDDEPNLDGYAREGRCGEWRMGLMVMSVFDDVESCEGYGPAPIHQRATH
eukprot:scaffold2445_cov205-Alexandrium_tamarense.AAC.17